MKCRECSNLVPDATNKMYCKPDKVSYKYFMAKKIDDNNHKSVECAGQAKK